VLNDKGQTCTNSRGIAIPRPEVAIARDALATFNRLATQFGLSPSDRSRIQIPQKWEDEDDFI
jgi:phage terminase small subunit